MEKLFIPQKIRVGYQERKDTYTKRLAYVIYYDQKGKLRKEASWLSWCHLEDRYQDDYVRDKNGMAIQDKDGNYEKTKRLVYKGLGFDEFENEPTEGFVLNKGVGGQRQSWGWNARNEYIRVFDPRGFEFEISVANMLYILQECTSTKGKGLEGKFVYSWDGTELVLLPVDTYEYKMSSGFTANQSQKVTKDSMIAGHTYQFKDMSKAVYLGRKEFSVTEGKIKAHVFYDLGNKSFFYTSGFTKIALVIDTYEPENYAEIVESWEKKTNVNYMVDVQFEKIELDKIKNEYHAKLEIHDQRNKNSDYFSIGGDNNVVALKGTTDYTDLRLSLRKENKIDTTAGKINWIDVYHVDQYISKKNYRFENGTIKHDYFSDNSYGYDRKKPKEDYRNYVKHDMDSIIPLVDQYDFFQINAVLKDGTVISYHDYLKKIYLSNK